MNATVLVLALSSSLSFALGSQFFTHFTRRVSSLWMNLFKASFALIAFGLTILITTGWQPLNFATLGLLLLSGALGLAIGDYFLLRAFSEMGPGRTLILFGFQPVMLGFASYLVLGQGIDNKKLGAICFFILCLATFSLENFKRTGRWDFKAIIFAFVGMSFDSTGLLITRYTFDHAPMLTPLEGNFYRCIGALIALGFISLKWPIHFWRSFKQLDGRSKLGVCTGAFLGTYLSLTFYLQAVQRAHLASLASLAVAGTLFSSTIECLWDRKAPSKHLLLALAFFFMGMYVLL